MKGLRWAAKRLTDHPGLRLTALISAALLWAYVATQDLVEARMRVVLEIRNRPENSQIAYKSRLPRTVEVELRGRLKHVRALEEEDGGLSAYVDLSGLESGSKESLRVEVRSDYRVRILSMDPGEVEVILEKSRK